MSDYLDSAEPLTSEEIRFAETNIDHAIHYAQRASKAMRRLAAEIRHLRALALTSEECADLTYLRQFGGTSMRFTAGQSAAATDTMYRALAILDRLLATSDPK